MSDAAATTERFRAAIEAGDVDRFMETLAPNVVINSPITMRTRFEGHDQVRPLMEAVLATIEGIRYTDDVGNDEVRALSYRARVGGADVQEATFVRLDADAKVREITLFFRPHPGLTALIAVLGPELARRRHGRLRAALVRAGVRPMLALSRFSDRVGARLVGLD